MRGWYNIRLGLRGLLVLVLEILLLVFDCGLVFRFWMV